MNDFYNDSAIEIHVFIHWSEQEFSLVKRRFIAQLPPPFPPPLSGAIFQKRKLSKRVSLYALLSRFNFSSSVWYANPIRILKNFDIRRQNLLPPKGLHNVPSPSLPLNLGVLFLFHFLLLFFVSLLLTFLFFFSIYSLPLFSLWHFTLIQDVRWRTSSEGWFFFRLKTMLKK